MSDRVTPVPIPNTAVKPVSADDSRKAKVGRCLDNVLSFFVPFLYILALFRPKIRHTLDKILILCYINPLIESTLKRQIVPSFCRERQNLAQFYFFKFFFISKTSLHERFLRYISP